MSDYSSVLIPGPWSHDFIAANGARFHIAQAGPAEPRATVLLLHSFPQFWWAWRHQITALADAGYRAVAMDLRGVGASDKPPSGYDIPTRTRDVAGVLRALGAEGAVVVGHGTGGAVAWAMAAMQPAVTDAVVAISSPHPTRLHRPARSVLTRQARKHSAFYQVPMLPERALTQASYVKELLVQQAPGTFSPEDLETYDNAMNVPFAAHNSLEAMRWLVRSKVQSSGRQFTAAMRKPLHLPAMQIHGDDDLVVKRTGADLDAAAMVRELRFESIPDVGYYAPEEAPTQVNELLLDFLARLP